MWRTGAAYFDPATPIRSTLAHYYRHPLHVVTACGATPRGPLRIEDTSTPGAARCERCIAATHGHRTRQQES